MHTRLMIFGVALVAAVAFGFIFWGEFVNGQQTLADLYVEVNP